MPKEDSFNYDHIVDQIKYNNSNIVFISCRCDNYPFAINISKKIKKSTNALIVLGGPQPTHTAYETLKTFNFIDIIIKGEGEETTAELIDALKVNKNLKLVKGILFREKGCIFETEERKLLQNINIRPLYEILPLYEKNIIKSTVSCMRIEVGRGCPYFCTFCSTCNMWRRQYRLKSVSDIYNEMMNMNKLFGVTHFIFEHDSLTANKIEFSRFINSIAKLNSIFTWECSSRIDTFPIELINLIKKAGCKSIYFGIESGSTKIQNKIKKNLKLEKVDIILKELLNNNIKFTASFIYGHPEENMKDIEATLKLAVKCSLYSNCNQIQLHKLSPVNGSEMFEQFEKDLEFDGIISDQAKIMLGADELKMIKENKRIFSAFYSFKTPYIEKDFLRCLSESANDIIKYYSKSLYITNKVLKIDIHTLIFMIYKKNDIYNVILNLFNIKNIRMPKFLKNIINFEKNIENISKKSYNFYLKNNENIKVNPSLVMIESNINPLNIDSIINLELQEEQIFAIWKNKNNKTVSIDILDTLNIAILKNVKIEYLNKNKYIGKKIQNMIKKQILIR